MDGRHPRRLLGLATAIAATLLSPATALGLTTRSASTSKVVGDGILVATAHCHAGEHVISGGFRGPGQNVVLVSRRQGPRGWKAVTEAHGGAKHKLTAFAYCSKRFGLTVHAGPVVTIPASGDFVGSAKARCGNGEVVISGGYETIKPAASTREIEAFKSMRARDDAWKIVAGNNEFRARFRAFAYCRAHGAPKERTGSTSGIGDNQADSATAQCKHGEKLLSGGYSTSPKTDFHNHTGPDLFYNTSNRSARRSWTAAAHNYGMVAGTITAIAYCS